MAPVVVSTVAVNVEPPGSVSAGGAPMLRAPDSVYVCCSVAAPAVGAA